MPDPGHFSGEDRPSNTAPAVSPAVVSELLLTRQQIPEMFRLLVDSIPDYAVMILDPGGHVASWNPGAVRLLGHRIDDVLGKHHSLFYVPEDIAIQKPSRDLQTAASENRFDYEGWHLRQDGSRFWAGVVITTLRNQAYALLGYGYVIRDLSGRQRVADQFRLAIEAAPAGMIMIDQDGKIVLVNAQVEELFGYHRAELMGRSIEVLVPTRFRNHHPGFRASFFATPKARPMGAGRDLFGLRKDGSEMPIEIGLNPLETPEGRFVLSSVVDITERKRVEQERENLLVRLQVSSTDLEQRVNERTAELISTLNEREVLLQEIHHRVKNNLQVISSLMNLQLRRISDRSTREALQEGQARVQAISLIHEMLYQSRDYANVPFSEYARRLAANVFGMAGVTSESVTLNLAIDDVALAVDKAIPCGLILNELITNALKHAFPDGRRGTVHVALTRTDGGKLRLSVEDDGVGIPPGFDFRQTQSLGMHLVCTLAEQLGAELEFSRDSGTAIRFTFLAGGG